MATDLTGSWIADDGGVYFLRQVDDTIWWTGLSAESNSGVNDYWLGLVFSNVLRGTVQGTTITAEWADVPKGIILGNGTLTIDILSDTELQKREGTGGFGASRWTKSELPPPLDIRARFDRVRRNDGGTMHDHLKVYKDYVVFYGRVLGDFHASCSARANRRYANFMCNEDGGFSDDDFDGDVNFDMRVDRRPGENTLGTALDAQAGFFVDGWFNDPNQVRAKLDDSDNFVHCEVIMYGRPAGKDNCEGNVSPLLPGWNESGANSMLFNGRPVSGKVDITAPEGTPGSTRLLKRGLPPGTRVRVTGFLALDCHGGDCSEDDRGEHNQEIHPVYAIDFIQPLLARDLIGVWGSDDVGTYYVRQVGDTVWWLGLSRDQGRTFANVFRGTINFGPGGTGPFIDGQWADVPLGATQGSGSLQLEILDPSTLAASDVTGGFGGRRWERLYYIPLQVIFPQAGDAHAPFDTDTAGHLVITLRFNRPVRTETVMVGSNVILRTARDANAEGSLAFSADRKQVVFTSTKTTSELLVFDPDAFFDITLKGDGNGAITDDACVPLDGDGDGVPGGAYSTGFTIVG